jgi:beta-galactosidase
MILLPDSGYSPKMGFCDLEHTKLMAKRIKAAGLKFLLDFHYSDTWADPGKQFKPTAWRGLSFPVLKDSMFAFTKKVITELKAQGTTPDMVQIGNEINHGMIWPDGHVSHLDNLAQLIKAGTDAVLQVDPSIVMLLHIALGGQNDDGSRSIPGRKFLMRKEIRTILSWNMIQSVKVFEEAGIMQA